MISVHIKRENLETNTQGEHHIKMKADIWVILLQAKECQRWLASHQKQGERHRTDSASWPSEGTNPHNILTLTSSVQRTVRQLLFKTTSLWHFVTVALANWYNDLQAWNTNSEDEWRRLKAIRKSCNCRTFWWGRKKVSKEPVWLSGDMHSNLGLQKGKKVNFVKYSLP